jgi:hypothetical protein
MEIAKKKALVMTVTIEVLKIIFNFQMVCLSLNCNTDCHLSLYSKQFGFVKVHSDSSSISATVKPLLAP